MELPSHIDPTYVTRVLRTFCADGDVTEARILGVPQAGHISGYFIDFERLASSVARYDGRAQATYFTLNPVQPALLARGDNRLVEWAKHTTSDADIVCRRWLLIDFDPERPAGISSSDTELQAAIARREEVIEWLDLNSFPSGLCGMSGNGAHLLYRLDNLPNNEENTTLVRNCLTVLAARFGDKAVSIDRKVFNPSRLCKLYGTLVRKGDNMPDRPHRRSSLDIPTVLPEPVSLEQLHWLASQPAETARVTVPRTASQVTAGRRLDVAAYLAAAGLVEGRDYRAKHKKGTTWYNFRLCPVHADPHPNFECGICQADDGAMGAKCQHDSSKTWRDFKVALGDPSRFYLGGDAVRSEPQSPLPLQGATRTNGGEIEMDQVLAFARCPTEHLWRYAADVMPPLTGDRLVHETVREGLLRFLTGAAASPLEGVQARWQELLSAWDVSKVYELLDAYARAHLEIMLLFMSGKITQRDGRPYQDPRSSQVYRHLCEKKGMLCLRVEVERIAQSIPAVLTQDASLTDLFADTVEISLRFQSPLPSQIIGIQEPFSISLPDGRTLRGQVDLAHRGSEDKAILELWDFATPSSWRVLRHDLRVIAALHARSDKWPGGVASVRVRYLRTGDVADVFGHTRLPWTLSVLSTACQATQGATGAPRLSVSAAQCKGCPYWTECTSDTGWNILGAAHPH